LLTPLDGTERIGRWVKGSHAPLGAGAPFGYFPLKRFFFFFFFLVWFGLVCPLLKKKIKTFENWHGDSSCLRNDTQGWPLTKISCAHKHIRTKWMFLNKK
jgi:hypothetical protein